MLVVCRNVFEALDEAIFWPNDRLTYTIGHQATSLYLMKRFTPPQKGVAKFNVL